MKKYWILLAAFVMFVVGVLICILQGNDFHIGSYTLRYFSSGDFALGVFSAGIFSIGVFSIGIFSIGIFSIGIFNIGLFAIGLFLIAWRKRLPLSFSQHYKSTRNVIKKPLLVLMLVALSITVSAQKNKKITIEGGYGGPIINSSLIASKPTLSIGGGGAMILNNGFYIGGFGLGTSDLVPVSSKYDNYNLQVEYGGFWLGYIEKLKKGYRISTSIKTGFGAAKLKNDHLGQLYYDDLVVFTPEISLSKRINCYSSIELGVFYNIFTGISFQNYHNNDFSNIGVSLMFKFGGGYF